MNVPRSRNRLAATLLSVAAAVVLSACGTDLHDGQANATNATAALALQSTGDETGAAVLGGGAQPAALAMLPVGSGAVLTGFRVGLRRVALRPLDGAGTAMTPSGDHVVDLLDDPAGHVMGPAVMPGGRSYQVDLELWPMPGMDPGDPAGAWAMAIELRYPDPAGNFTHTFSLRWEGPAAFHMNGADGLAMGSGGHELILAFRMERILTAPYGAGTILDALLATPMDADGRHLLRATEHPDLFAAILAAMDQGMDFGEDLNHDGHLRSGEDRMVGHHGGPGMM